MNKKQRKPIFDVNKMAKVIKKPALDSNEVSNRVLDLMQKQGNTIAYNMPEHIKHLCDLFNYCIDWQKSNGGNKESYHRLVNAAQTGSGKSLTLKVYVSMLKEHSSLIIVSKVDEALEYCEFINKLRNNDNYARCYYSITDKNKDSPLRTDSYKLNEYQCIVISHSMFQNVNLSDSLDTYKLYKNKQRDLIVIDEKLHFFKSTILSIDEFNEFYGYLMLLIQELNLDDNSLSLFNEIMRIIDLYDEDVKDNNNNLLAVDLDDLERINQLLEGSQTSLRKIKKIFKDRLNWISSELTILTGKKNTNINSLAINNIEDFIQKIKYIFHYNDEDESYPYYYVRQNQKLFFRVESIVNKLGTCLILDATSTINEYYKMAFKDSYNILKVRSKPIRRYSNLTIYKAKGFSQGRTSTYKSKSKQTIEQKAKMYMSYAHNLLTKSDDKILIITHLGFKKYLQEQTSDERIQFTHWGDHIGKNDWNDCNKVIIIGWHYLNELHYIYNIFSASNNSSSLDYRTTKYNLQKFKVTQLADDIIQGVMRSQARIIDTLDGDCKKTDIYIFYKETKESQEVFSLMESQFPDCNFIEWKPIGISNQITKTKRVITADKIINCLDEAAKTNHTIQLKNLRIELDLKPYQVSKVINSDYFINLLKDRGYIYKTLNGKSKHFIL